MRGSSDDKKNFWIHVLEGALYLSTGFLLSPQTVFPALIARLGGGNIVIGAIPIVVYLAFFLPQVFSANFVRSVPYRKQLTLRFGILQRLQILLIAVVIGILGLDHPTLALVAFFAIYVTNQALAGFGSPIWFDLVAKTSNPADRGKLMGIRISLGALLGLMNSLLLTILLAYLAYPYNYAAVFGISFILQLASWMVQHGIQESHASTVEPTVPYSQLVGRLAAIVRSNVIFKRFLIAGGISTIGLMPVGFFTVAAMKKFSLNESYVGLFTITTVVAQILSGAVLGWLADKKGHKSALLLCSASIACATLCALLGSSVVFYFGTFFLVGVNLGAETMTRYNFAVNCAPENERPLYVGVMNAWLAPFYLSATLGGWLSDMFGYNVVFVTGLAATCFGMLMLSRLPSAKPRQLAVSSK
jgi:hypothetical protein